MRDSCRNTRSWLRSFAASFDVGIITGSRTVNPILSLMINKRAIGQTLAFLAEGKFTS